MKFGIREVCDCYFKSKDGKGPNFTIDTATMSTLDSATNTVYANGGKGHARLAAWEGEKTLTFTIESAIMTSESLAALTGSQFKENKLVITSDKFAGYYEITANTLFRDIDDGEDKAAVIYIPKAKLQSTINIPMASSGDPASFTFTFDAFAHNGTLCEITLAGAGDTAAATETTTVTVLADSTTYFVEDDSITGNSAILAVSSEGIVTFNGENLANTTLGNLTLATDEVMVNGVLMIARGQSASISKGTSTVWYII